MQKLIDVAVLAVAVAALLPAAASAQTDGSSESLASVVGHFHPTFYGTLGYAEASLDHADLGAIQVRLGSRLSTYFGVEAEGLWGVNDASHTSQGVRFPERLSSQEAVYGVGYLPISPNLELLARVGYGHTSGTGPQTVFITQHGTLEAPVHDAGVKGDSWNFGVGGQYMFDANNGARIDYVREDYRTWDTPDANVWSVSYLRKF